MESSGGPVGSSGGPVCSGGDFVSSDGDHACCCGGPVFSIRAAIHMRFLCTRHFHSLLLLPCPSPSAGPVP